MPSFCHHRCWYAAAKIAAGKPPADILQDAGLPQESSRGRGVEVERPGHLDQQVVEHGLGVLVRVLFGVLHLVQQTFRERQAQLVAGQQRR